MPATFSDTAMDQFLNYWGTCTIMVACSAAPTNYTELTSTYALADTTLAGGDFTKADGDVSGRKSTRAAKTGITVDSSGTATFVGYGISGSSTWVASVPCNSTVLTASGTVDFGAHKIEIPDPS